MNKTSLFIAVLAAQTSGNTSLLQLHKFITQQLCREQDQGNSSCWILYSVPKALCPPPNPATVAATTAATEKQEDSSEQQPSKP